MSATFPSRSLYVATLGALLAVVGCSDENIVAPSRAAAPAAARHTISVSSASVAMLSVEVSGEGMKDPLLYNLPVAGGKSDGALATPAAEGRQLVVRGYDAQGNLLGTGTTAVGAIRVGKNEPVSVSLFAKGMEKGISASFDVVGEESLKGGSVVVEAPKELREGQTAKVRATVYDASGLPMEVDPREIHWAVSDPRLANIIPDGRGYVTIEALRTGIVYLIAIDRNIATRRPIPVAIDLYVQVSAGVDFTCGRKQSGAVKCWGDNAVSQLGAATTQSCGNPSQPCSDRPVTVSGGRVYSSISSGGRFVCGIETNGHISCWGKNDKGQLGMGSIGTPGGPVSLNSTATFTALTTGGDHACAIANTTGREAFCWGLNNWGQLGDNTPGYFSFNPMQQPTPVLVSGGFGWRSIAGGKEHTCGVTTNSRAMCWGSNYYGELGTGPINSTFPVPSLVNTPITANFPDMNSAFSGPDAYGTCWARVGPVDSCNGANSRGQAGVGGSSVSVNQPASLFGNPALLVISLGTQHVCGIDPSDNLFCWGDNKYGQIGIATTQQYFLNHPLQVGTYKFSGVTSGSDHSCGLTRAGDIYCWGRNDRGQLGIGSSGGSTATPTLIAQ